MKLLLDYFPIAAFVGVYFYSSAELPMYPAVQALMIASVVQTIGSRLLTGKFEKLHLGLLAITLVFGGMTLMFRNPDFLIWKASIVVWIMAIVFLYSQFIAKKPLIQVMLQAAVEGADVPKAIWHKINLVWPIGYIFFGFLNLYVAFNYSEPFWVKFKLFGLLALTFSLIIFSLIKLFPFFPLEETEDQTSHTEQDKLDDKER
jgi:intracellular septation protein